MKALKKYKVTIEDESHLAEIVSARFTIPVIAALIIGAFCIMLLLSGLIISFTPIRTLLPGYMKASQRSATEENLLRLDSLMAVTEMKRAYIDNFLRVTNINRSTGDSAAVKPVARELSSDSLLDPSEAEKNFISQMKERERFNISVIAPLAAENMLFYPVSSDGSFTKESESSETGEIILPRDENVQCAADGAVIALYYSATERGYVVVVQHKRGFVTSYTHVGSPLVGIGDIVNAGQIIALSPAPDSKGKRSFIVRMWHNGLPIIPFDYIGDKERNGEVPVQTYDSPRGKL